MTNDRLTDFVGLREAVDEVEGILHVAVQLLVIRSLQHAARIDRQGFILRQRGAKLIEHLAIGFFDQIVGMLEVFLKTEASEIIVVFKGETQRVHFLVAAPAVGIASANLHALAERLFLVRMNHGIDRDRNVGNGAGQELFPDPFTPVDRVGLEVLGMSNEPGRMGQDPFAVGNLRRLVGGIVPGPPVEVPVGRDLFAAHLLSGPAEHRATVPEAHPVFHIRQSAGLALAKVQFKAVHHLLQLPENLRVIPFLLALEFPVLSQESLVRGDVFRLPFLPVGVFEFVVNAFQGIGRGRHRLVVAVVKNVELVGGQQFFKDPLVLLEKMFNQHVRLFDQSADGLFVATGSKAAIVLEDLEGLGIAEEVTEEPQLPDRLVRHTGVEVGRLYPFIDDRPSVAALEHPADFTFVVLAGLEASILNRFRQLLIRTGIGQRVGEGVTRIPRRHHSPTMFIRGTRAKFVAVGKLGVQDQGLDQLGHGLLPPDLGHEQFEQFPVLGPLRFTRRTLQNPGIQLIDQGLDPGVIRTRGRLTLLLEGRSPIGHTLFNDRLVAVTLLAMLLDRRRDHSHLLIVQRLVCRRRTTFPRFAINQLHVPVIPEHLHHGDPVLNAIGGDALPDPVAFGLQNDLLVV